MSHYVIETVSKGESPRQWDAFQAESLEGVRSRTLIVLSDLARSVFEDGAESVNAAVKDETGTFVFAAKLSLTMKWLR